MQVRASDAAPAVPKDAAFWVEKMDAAAACRRHDPLIVVCSWMTIGQDWSEAFRESGVLEYVLVGSLLDADARCNAYSLLREQPPYERTLLPEVSRALNGIADALEGDESPFGEGGSVCAVSYRRPLDD